MKFFQKKIIYRLGSNETDPYLIRWTLFHCSLFDIKVHKILRSDDDCLHDHPWSFISIILKGGYIEVTTKKGLILAKDAVVTRDLLEYKNYGVGSILFRPCLWRHRLIITKPTWTLVFTSKRIREWGFWTPLGWMPWFKYNDKSGGC